MARKRRGGGNSGPDDSGSDVYKPVFKSQPNGASASSAARPVLGALDTASSSTDDSVAMLGAARDAQHQLAKFPRRKSDLLAARRLTATPPTVSVENQDVLAAAAQAGFANFKAGAPAAPQTNGSVSSPHKGKARAVDGEVDPRILDARKALPIWAGRDAIVQAVRANDTVILLGETGSGKTTQIPQFLYEAGFCDAGAEPSGTSSDAEASSSAHQLTIGITQPRRVAAISLARRVAQEMGCPDPQSMSHALLRGSAKARRKHKRSNSAQNGSLAPPAAAEAPAPAQAVPANALVGYSIRFDDRTSAATRIKFMTDGFVLREMMGPGLQALSQASTAGSTRNLEPSLLTRYSVLIIDEAHERTLDTDLVLGLAKSIQRERKRRRREWVRAKEAAAKAGKPFTTEAPPPELKIVVMSATLDAQKFADFFSTDGQPAPILHVQGRQHAVEICHSRQACADWSDAALRTVLQIHLDHPPGDVLVFMTGQEEIEKMRSQLETFGRELKGWHAARAGAAASDEPPNGKRRKLSKQPPDDMLVLPMYAALGSDASMAAFQPTPPHTRKIVLATNIAETSVTIPGIKYVVDSGLAKVKKYSHSTGVEVLNSEPISRSSAMQRAGRAGRDGPGTCFHLYTKDAFDGLDESPTPDILKVDLANACLQLCAIGRNPQTFDWIDAPAVEDVTETMIRLVQLGAVTLRPASDQREEPVITALGAKMAMLPLSPSFARVLLAAAQISPTVARQARDLVAILSADRGMFVEPNDPEKRDAATQARASLAHPSGDHATFLSVFYQFIAISEQAYRLSGKGKRAREEIQAWCEAHFVHYRTMSSIFTIRQQLRRICTQRGIVCDDEDGSRSGKRAGSSVAGSSSLDLNGDDDFDDMSSIGTGGGGAADGLFVSRPGQQSAMRAHWQTLQDESYEQLRKALLPARTQQFAFRNPEGPGYKRGSEIVKIHPSSVLAHKQPAVIVFEEVVLTTQLFVRCVSAVEPSWVSEAMSSVRANGSHA